MIKVLFQGWFEIPHSYAVCNCFQLVFLVKNFSHQIDFYIEEQSYYNPEWNNNRKWIYPQEYIDILTKLKKYTRNEKMDLVYRQTFPYNITEGGSELKNVPKCVFYTSEFRSIDANYFTTSLNSIPSDTYISKYLANTSNIHFLTPSTWSAHGMSKYIPEHNLASRQRVITHGVDTSLFKKDLSMRNAIRQKYNIKETDTLMINIGSMTRNKGIVLILQTMHILVHKANKTHYKLILKGTKDLYQSKLFMEIYFGEMEKQKFITRSEIDNLLNNHIIFIDNTISFGMINNLFNACDLYISPYLCEGFGLTMLEALSAGLRVLVPKTGSTVDYMSDLYMTSFGNKFIYYTESKVIESQPDKFENSIDINNLVNCVLNINFEDNSRHYTDLHMYIEKKYSWDTVSKQLYEYFNHIISVHASD